jgi:acetyltransferase-like isoleucine patch superfamily enzyme
MGHKLIKAYIDPSAKIGDGTIIWHFAVVLQDVKLGANVSIGSRCEIGRGSVIGENTRIGSGTFLPPNSMVGPNVFIGPNVTCTDDRHPVIHQPGDAPYTAEPPVIEEGAAIGAGAVLLPGVRIGKHARVAAGAIVTRDVIEYGMVMGKAARPRTMPREWEHPSWNTSTATSA